MEHSIVITDVTRFKNKDLLCVAGVTTDGKTCIRPLQKDRIDNHFGYLTYQSCKELNILPGTIIKSNFISDSSIGSKPHIEDRFYTTLTRKGTCTSSQFEEILSNSLSSSVAVGFGTPEIKEKVLPLNIPIRQSIITVEARVDSISIIHDNYGKIKLHFTDLEGVPYSYLPITDRGFYDFVGNPDTQRISANEITKFLNRQNKVLLRIGLSRLYESEDGRIGYWMQVNGVYSFPEFNQILRSYQ